MISRRARSPWLVALCIAAFVGLGLLGTRSLGLLESLELATYDAVLRLRPAAPAADPRIVLISITEADIQRLGGWPVPDGILARALEIVGRHEPRAVGLDIYRDVPVPPGTEQLDVVFRSDPRIVVVTKFGEGPSSGVRPPAALQDSDQVGFNDILVDPGGIVRRGLLFLDDGQTAVHSFALRLALRYLEREGIGPQADPQSPISCAWDVPRSTRSSRTTAATWVPTRADTSSSSTSKGPVTPSVRSSSARSWQDSSSPRQSGTKSC